MYALYILYLMLFAQVVFYKRRIKLRIKEKTTVCCFFLLFHSREIKKI